MELTLTDEQRARFESSEADHVRICIGAAEQRAVDALVEMAVLRAREGAQDVQRVTDRAWAEASTVSDLGSAFAEWVAIGGPTPTQRVEEKREALRTGPRNPFAEARAVGLDAALERLSGRVVEEDDLLDAWALRVDPDAGQRVA
jgi:hypothetical protein